MSYTKDGCGCYVKSILGNTTQVEIIYWPIHKAAPDMYEAITSFLGGYKVWLIDPDKSPNSLSVFVKPLLKALAKAGGNTKLDPRQRD